MIPDGWSITSLADLALVERGKFSARPRNDPKYYGGSIPFVQTGDITSSEIFLTQYTQTLNEEGLKVSRLFPTNIILMTIAANIGDTAITTFDVACPDSVVAIQPYKDKSDVFWLKQALETCKGKLDSLATQNAQKNINLQVLRPLCMHTPPLPEQKKIAEILSTWDKAIATVEKLIANSQQKKKALMQQLLTGKKRFPEFDGEWKEVRLKDVASMSSGGTPKSSISEYYNGNIPWVSIADMTKHGKTIHRTERNITQFGLENSSTRMYPKNTVLYAMYASIGECSIAAVELCSSQAILGIQPNKTLSFEYLYYYLSSIKNKIGLQGQQGTQSNLNAGMVKGFKLNLPEIAEQQKISSVLSSADQEIETWQQELENLKQEKKALMQQLLTGKRRVKVAVSATETLQLGGSHEV